MSGIEEFKEAFRQTQWCADMRGMRGMPDPEIFERANSGRTFYKVQTNDAWRIWRLASIRAGRLVIRATEVPADAKNPTRDHIVILGEEIRNMILHDMESPGADRQKFEAKFKETQEFKTHVQLGYEKECSIFDRHPVTGDYYHPSAALAWDFYKLGAK